MCLYNDGRFKGVKVSFAEVMKTRKMVLGAEHPSTLTGMNLAHTWKSEGRDSEALKLMEECVQLPNRALGVDHPQIVSFSIYI
jgi:hypothetical protein